MFLLTCFAAALKDSDPLITQEFVDEINNDPNAPFKAVLYPKFAKMTVGDAKRFLSPVRPPPQNHGSAVPVGANEAFFNFVDKNYVTGLTNVKAFPDRLDASNQNQNPQVDGKTIQVIPKADTMRFPIFDVTKLCSSWAPAVTSAMTISVSRWAGQFVNFSLQYVLDCDMLGDSCIERTPLNAYQLFWTYHPPNYNGWDKPGDGNSERKNYMDAPREDFTREHCHNDKCYPGTTNCGHYWALTGSCNPGDPETACPIYFLYNWRWIKSHLWEVGAVTSSIVVHPTLFSYGPFGVYSSKWKTATDLQDDSRKDEVLGMLDVTIVGWGQTFLNLSNSQDIYSQQLQRWWWVIPHFGRDFGVSIDTCTSDPDGVGSYKDVTSSNHCIKMDKIELEGAGSDNKGFIMFNRRFDDCNIESHAVGAVPYNFVPLPYRTPSPTTSEGN